MPKPKSPAVIDAKVVHEVPGEKKESELSKLTKMIGLGAFLGIVATVIGMIILASFDHQFRMAELPIKMEAAKKGMTSIPDGAEEKKLRILMQPPAPSSTPTVTAQSPAPTQVATPVATQYKVEPISSAAGNLTGTMCLSNGACKDFPPQAERGAMVSPGDVWKFQFQHVREVNFLGNTQGALAWLCEDESKKVSVTVSGPWFKEGRCVFVQGPEPDPRKFPLQVKLKGDV